VAFQNVDEVLAAVAAVSSRRRRSLATEED
jgi:hypothetical protein